MYKKIFLLLMFCSDLIGMDQEGQRNSFLAVDPRGGTLPKEVIYRITHHCDLPSIGNFKQACKQFNGYDTADLMCSTRMNGEDCCSIPCSNLKQNYDQCSPALAHFAVNEQMFGHLYEFHRERRDEELKKIYSMPASITMEDRTAAYAGKYVNKDLVNEAVSEAIETEELRQMSEALRKVIKKNKPTLLKQMLVSHGPTIKNNINSQLIHDFIIQQKNSEKNNVIEVLFDNADLFGIEISHILTGACKKSNFNMINLCWGRLESEYLEKILADAFFRYISIDSTDSTDSTYSTEDSDSTEDSIDVAYSLIQKGIDCQKYSRDQLIQLLCRACEKGDRDIVEILVDKDKTLVNVENNEGFPPLYYAVGYEHSKIVKFLLKNGAYVNINFEDGSSLFSRACCSENLKIVQLLIKNGAQVNTAACEDKLIQLLCETRGQWTCTGVRSILENIDQDLFNQENLDKWQPLLYYAVRYGHFEVVRFLLEKGVCVNFSIKGQTPLYVACIKAYAKTSYARIAQLLIRRGAKIKLGRNEEGSSVVPLPFLDRYPKFRRNLLLLTLGLLGIGYIFTKIFNDDVKLWMT